MATIVLVHGAWAGGWVWARMTPHLRAAGHDVYTPTLTGSGERSHLLTREVDLNTHVDDIANVLKFENLDDVILVGHSYSGMVITEIANKMPERIAHLVFIDAFVPEAGLGLLEGSTVRSAMESSAEERGDGWRVPALPIDYLGISEPEDVEWAEPRMSDHPLNSFLQAVDTESLESDTIERTYIRATDGSSSHIETVKRIKAQGGWSYREIPTGHQAMVTMPLQLAVMLNEIAE